MYTPPPLWCKNRLVWPHWKKICKRLWTRDNKVGIIEIDGLASSLFRPRRFALPRAAGFFLLCSPPPLGKSTAISLACKRPRLAATVCAERPNEGLTGIHVCGVPYGGRLLGMCGRRAAFRCGDAGRVARPRRRSGGRLSETRERPLRIDVVWRAVEPVLDDDFLAAVDLLVSVRTELLDARPRSSSRASFPRAEPRGSRASMRCTSLRWTSSPARRPCSNRLWPPAACGCISPRCSGIMWR